MRFTNVRVINVPLVLLALIVGAAALPGYNPNINEPMDLGSPHFSFTVFNIFLALTRQCY